MSKNPNPPSKALTCCNNAAYLPGYYHRPVPGISDPRNQGQDQPIFVMSSPRRSLPAWMWMTSMKSPLFLSGRVSPENIHKKLNIYSPPDLRKVEKAGGQHQKSQTRKSPSPCAGNIPNWKIPMLPLLNLSITVRPTCNAKSISNGLKPPDLRGYPPDWIKSMGLVVSRRVRIAGLGRKDRGHPPGTRIRTSPF